MRSVELDEILTMRMGGEERIVAKQLIAWIP
jgi:hypothetical protein